MVKLGVLDQSHVAQGRNASDALRETTQLAQETDRLGYTRYWVAEHHATESLGSSSPEILIAHLAAHTTRMRIGSGGVMLPHYSAYKVAEQFRLLEALYPGRIDVGLGRAPGGMPLATRALQEGKAVAIDRYPEQVTDLLHYMHDTLPPDHRFAGLVASPVLDHAPPVWLLGSSDESARIAARLGLSYGFAQFFGVPGGAIAMQLYREQFRPSVWNEKPYGLAAVLVVCAPTDEEADLLASSNELFFLQLEKGERLLHLPSVEAAQRYPYTAYDKARIQSRREQRVIGSPETVKHKLERIAQSYGADELLVVSPIHDHALRLRSYQLLARIWGMTDGNNENRENN